LCSGGLNLRDPSQVMAAILRYNNSMLYAQNVLGWAAAYATGVVPIDLPPITGPPAPLGDAHDQHPEGLGPGLPMNVNGLPGEGLGPGLPMNINGLPVNDPLARMPLIDFGPPQILGQPPMWPSQSPTPSGPGCTLICIGRQDPLPPQQPPWVTLPPPDAPPLLQP
jgi:hypothetical protein